jgi:hypothetical protein
MGRREGNYTSKKKSKEDFVGNEENGYPVPDPNTTMINVTNEPSGTHKNPSTRTPWKRSLGNSWRRY